ncbi:MAG: secondary thiamine-phosphate synthase enzyme YjbQ [bacterium]
MKIINVATTKREVFVDITEKIKEEIDKDGIIYLFVPHTTCAITINEGYDPEVCSDIIRCLSNIIKRDSPYFRHNEGNSDAHIKASIIGSSLSIFVKDKRLVLGTWQRIFLCEFDGPREREIWIKCLA